MRMNTMQNPGFHAQQTPQQRQVAPQQPPFAPPFIPQYLFPPAHIPAAQLPQMPGMMLHTEGTSLLCIPVQFNQRDMTMTCQNGVLVYPNVSTFVAGFHIIPQSMVQPNPMPPVSQSQVQQHQMNGSPSGSSGFGDSTSMSGSRDNIAQDRASRQSPTHPANLPQAPLINGNMPYGFQGLSHFPAHNVAISGGAPLSHAGFLPVQGHLVYAQAQPMNAVDAHHSAGHSANAGGQPLFGEENHGPDSASSDQTLHANAQADESRSSSFSSDERGHAGVEDGSRPSSLEGGELEVSEEMEHEADALESISRVEEHTADKKDRTGSYRATPVLDQDDGNQTSGSVQVTGAIAADSRSASAATQTLCEPVSAGIPKVESRASLKSLGDEAVTSTPPPAAAGQPNSWAQLVARMTPAQTLASRPTHTPRSEAVKEKPAAVVETPMAPSSSGVTNIESSRGGLQNGHYAGNAGGRRFPRDTRNADGQWEFPRLTKDQAMTYPDELQVFLRDIPREISSTQIGEVMRGFGEVEDVRLRYHKDTTEFRFCFVLFKDKKVVDQLTKIGTVKIGSRAVKVNRKTANYNSN